MTGFPDYQAHGGDIAQSRRTVQFHVYLSVVNALNEQLLVFIKHRQLFVKSALFQVFWQSVSVYVLFERPQIPVSTGR